MAQSVLSVRMDQKTKEAFSRFCDEVGLSVSAAVTLFARQTIRNQAIPFAIEAGPAKESASSERCARPFSAGEGVLEVADIGAAVARASANYPAIRKAILFGSYARGEATPESDVDVRIQYDPNVKFSLLDLSGYHNDLESALRRQVDIVSARELSDKAFADAIERDGVIIYER